MHPALKAWDSFLFHALESSSKTSKLIMKRVGVVMSIMHDEPIYVGCLIIGSINSIFDRPHKTCGHFCIINELCKVAGVQG